MNEMPRARSAARCVVAAPVSTQTVGVALDPASDCGTGRASASIARSRSRCIRVATPTRWIVMVAPAWSSSPRGHSTTALPPNACRSRDIAAGTSTVMGVVLDERSAEYIMFG